MSKPAKTEKVATKPKAEKAVTKPAKTEKAATKAKAAPTEKAPKAAKAEKPVFKKGQTVQWTTGCRWGQMNYKGTIVAVVPAKIAPAGLPAAASTALERNAQKGKPWDSVSNRDRVVVKRGDGDYAFANAPACTVVPA